MKVFIAGATGRVAEQLIQHLIAQGHQVVAGARSPEKIAPQDGVTAVSLDLHASASELANVIKGSDAVYFTAGSRGKDLLQTDAFGAVKLMQASKQVGIKRFVMLSSIFATEPDKWEHPYFDHLADYNVAKFFADEWLMYQSGLDYTIIQPGRLIEAKQGSGLISINVSEPGENTIPNVA